MGGIYIGSATERSIEIKYPNVTVLTIKQV